MMVDTDPFDEITLRLMREAAALLGVTDEITPADFSLRDMCGAGYAIPSEAGNAAVRLMAEREGLFLDPVYTGKATYGMVNELREGGRLRSSENILFIHTGGLYGLFPISRTFPV